MKVLLGNITTLVLLLHILFTANPRHSKFTGIQLIIRHEAKHTESKFRMKRSPIWSVKNSFCLKRYWSLYDWFIERDLQIGVKTGFYSAWHCLSHVTCTYKKWVAPKTINKIARLWMYVRTRTSTVCTMFCS